MSIFGSRSSGETLVKLMVVSVGVSSKRMPWETGWEDTIAAIVDVTMVRVLITLQLHGEVGKKGAATYYAQTKLKPTRYDRYADRNVCLAECPWKVGDILDARFVPVRLIFPLSLFIRGKLKPVKDQTLDTYKGVAKELVLKR